MIGSLLAILSLHGFHIRLLGNRICRHVQYQVTSFKVLIKLTFWHANYLSVKHNFSSWKWSYCLYFSHYKKRLYFRCCYFCKQRSAFLADIISWDKLVIQTCDISWRTHHKHLQFEQSISIMWGSTTMTTGFLVTTGSFTVNDFKGPCSTGSGDIMKSSASLLCSNMWFQFHGRAC